MPNRKYKDRVTGGVGGEIAEKIRTLAKEIDCSPRELVETMLTVCDPSSAVKIILTKRLQEEKDKIDELKKKYGG